MDAGAALSHWNSGELAGLMLFALVGAVISLLVGDLRESLWSTARAEEALARQARLINLSHDAIITADGNRVITGWNSGAHEMYGWTEREAVGQAIHEFLSTAARFLPRGWSAFWPAKAGGTEN